MNKQNKNEWYTSSEFSNIKNSSRSSRVSGFIEYTHSLLAFHMIAGICQVLLGLAVITVSVLGLVQPFWVSAALIMGGSIATMIGVYLLYITMSNVRNKNSLLRTAMNRVMEYRN